MLLGAAFAFGYNEQEMPGEVCFEVFPQPDMSNLDKQILYKTRFIFLLDENMPVDVKTLTLGYQNTVSTVIVDQLTLQLLLRTKPFSKVTTD